MTEATTILPVGTIVRFRWEASAEPKNPPTIMVGRITSLSDVFRSYEVTVERITYVYVQPEGNTTIVPPTRFAPLVDFTDPTLEVLEEVPPLGLRDELKSHAAKMLDQGAITPLMYRRSVRYISEHPDEVEGYCAGGMDTLRAVEEIVKRSQEAYAVGPSRIGPYVKARKIDPEREEQMMVALRDRLDGTVDPRKVLADAVAAGDFTAEEVEELSKKHTFVVGLSRM